MAGTPGAAAGEFLRLPVNARSAALGGTAVGAGEGVASIEGNPAALGWLRRPEGFAAHAEWLGGVRFESLAGVAPVGGGRLGALGGQINYLHVSDLLRTDSLGNQNGTFAYRDLAVRAAYGRLIGNTLSAGGVMSVLSETIDDAGGSAVFMDLGFESRPGRSVVLGAVLQNVGTSLMLGGTGYPLPLTLREGVTVKIHGRRSGRDIILLSLEGTEAAFGASDLRGGVEVWPVRRLALRLGYRTRLASSALGASVGVSGGLGISHGPHWIFDYAYVPFGFSNALGSTHRVALGYRFGVEPAAAPPARPAPTAGIAGPGDVLIRASGARPPEWVARRPDPDGAFVYFIAVASGASTPESARDEAVHDLATQVVEYTGVGVRTVYDAMQRAAETQFREDLRLSGPVPAGRTIRERYDEEWLYEGASAGHGERRFTTALLAAYPHSALDWTRLVSGGTQTVAVVALAGHEVDAMILDTVTEQLQVALSSPAVAGRTVLMSADVSQKRSSGALKTPGPEEVFSIESARGLARELGATHLVLGTMSRIAAGYAIHVRLFDATRDRWAGKWSARASPSSELASSTLGARIRERLDRP